MKNQGVTIISVGVGNKVDLTELRNIASHPSLVVRSSDFSNFLSLLPTLQQIVCARKSINMNGYTLGEVTILKEITSQTD